MFNNNIGCIEIFVTGALGFKEHQFNNNIGCIEIRIKDLGIFKEVLFNNNIGCIEIKVGYIPRSRHISLIAT